MLWIMLACAPESADWPETPDYSDMLIGWERWQIPERADLRDFDDALIGWQDPLPFQGDPGAPDAWETDDLLVFDVTEERVGLVAEGPQLRLLLSVSRADLWPVLPEATFTPLAPGDEQVGVTYAAGTHVSDIVVRDHALMPRPPETKSVWPEHPNPIHTDTWVPTAHVDQVFRSGMTDPHYQFAYDISLPPDVPLLDAPDGDVLIAASARALPAILIEDLGGGVLVVEVDLPRERRVRGYAHTDLIAATPGSYHTLPYRCGLQRLWFDDIAWSSSTNIPEETPLHAWPEGPVVGVAVRSFATDVLDRDDGWSLIAVPTPWGDAELWADLW